MGQEFHVVRCFSCQSFQVQQVKKVNRWSCKLCGKKQTLLNEFGRGSGADCRRHVQKLNAMRGAMMEEQEHDTLSLWKQAEEEEETEPEEEQQVSQSQGSQAKVSRWIKYLDAPEEAEPEEAEPEEEDNVLLDRKQLHAYRMTDRKRKREGWTHTSTTEQQDPPSTTGIYKTTQTSQNQTCPNQTSLNKTCPNNTSLNKTCPNNTSLNQTCPNNTSLIQSSPPNKRRLTPPSLASGPGSRWACFLRSDLEVKDGEETSSGGRSQSEGGAVSSFCADVISTVSHPSVGPLLPVSSLFESGEEFIFDDFLSGSDF